MVSHALQKALFGEDLRVKDMTELPPQPDPRRTLLRAFGVLAMLVIAIFGMGYSAWYLYHLH